LVYENFTIITLSDLCKKFAQDTLVFARGPA